MSEPKFKVNDKVHVLFLETACRQEYRDHDSHSRYVLSPPCIGYIKEVNERADDTGNLYAVEFDETEINRLELIFDRLTEITSWNSDLGLHNCNGATKLNSGRYILEDALWPYVEPASTQSIVIMSPLRIILATCKRKQNKKKEKQGGKSRERTKV